MCALSKLKDRALIREDGEGYIQLHDVVRGYLRGSLSSKRLKEYHRMASAYYLKTASGLGKIEAQHHLIEAEARSLLPRWKFLKSHQEVSNKCLSGNQQVGAIEQPIIVSV